MRRRFRDFHSKRFGELEGRKKRISLTFGGVVVADVLDGVADDFLVVDVGLGRDFAAEENHARLADGL
jgi:hypothetical protein